MIHHKPICLGCEKPIDYDPVFAPPLCEHDDCASAVFHGICLMEWREQVDEARKQAQKMAEGFMRHIKGECSCYEEEADG